MVKLFFPFVFKENVGIMWNNYSALSKACNKSRMRMDEKAGQISRMIYTIVEMHFVN